MRIPKLKSGAFFYIILAGVMVAAASTATTAIVQQTAAQTVPELPVDRDISIYFKTFCISVIIVTWCF